MEVGPTLRLTTRQGVRAATDGRGRRAGARARAHRLNLKRKGARLAVGEQHADPVDGLRMEGGLRVLLNVAAPREEKGLKGHVDVAPLADALARGADDRLEEVGGVLLEVVVRLEVEKVGPPVGARAQPEGMVV